MPAFSNARRYCLIEFVSMPVAFSDQLLLIDSGSQSSVHNANVMSTKSHRASKVSDCFLFRQEVNYRVIRRWIELGRVRINQAENMSCEGNDCQLETKTQSQVGYGIFPGVVCRENLALASADSESLRNQDAVIIFKSLY